MMIAWVRKVKPWKKGIRYSICAVKPSDHDILTYGYIEVVPKSELDAALAKIESLKHEHALLISNVYGTRESHEI